MVSKQTISYGSIPAFVFAVFLLVACSYAADPLTTAGATAAGSAYSFGDWSKSAVSVTLSCVPGSSDCANVSYCTDTANACNPISGGAIYSSPVNVSTEGTSYIRYASVNSTGGWGDTASSTIKIDTILPAISISDGASSSWTNNDAISVSVSDNGSGLSSTKWIVRQDSACGASQDNDINSGTSGTLMQANNDSLYQSKYICFRAVDVAGNKAYAVSSQITRLDTTAPVVNAGADQGAKSQFTQNGAASDSGSGISSYSWSKTSGPGTITFGSQGSQGTTVSANTDGTYVITLTATDAAGNSGSNSFTLNWITTAPGITISNPDSSPAQSKMISASVPSGTLTMAATTGTVCDSSLPFVPYASSAFSAEADNGKKICYRVADSLGNTAYLLSSAVSGIDKTAPSLSLNGNSAVTIEAASNYAEAGATATDNQDSGISSKIAVNSTVNTGKVGTYLVTYDVTDAAGNKAPQLTRTVNVVDTTRPVITLLGNSTITLEKGAAYIDTGATAADNYDGVITSKIAAGGFVNTEAAGTYTLTYDVSDSSGNKAAQVARTVTVTDNTLWVIGGILLVVLVVVAVGGAAVYYLFMKKKGGL